MQSTERKPGEMAAGKELGFEGLLAGEGAPSMGKQGTYYQSGQEHDEGEHDMQESSAGGGMARDRTQTTSGNAMHGVDSGDPGMNNSPGRIDYVLAFEPGLEGDDTWNQSRDEKRQIFEKALKEDYKVYMEHEHESNDGKTSFVKLHIPFTTLCKWAEDMLMRLPLVVPLDGVTSHTTLERPLECCCCSSNPFDNTLDEQPNEYTAVFTCINIGKFLNYDKPNIFFSPAQRSRIAYEILSKARYGEDEHRGASDDPECGGEKKKIGIERLLGNKSYVAAYPLHEGEYTEKDKTADDNDRAKLYRAWGDWKSNWYRFQPLDHIRNYYGEKIAIYFAWLGYYTSVLIPPSIIGLIVFIIGCIIAYAGGNNVGTQVCDLKGLSRNNTRCADSLGVNDLACRNVLMCPLCDSGCAYWHLADACTYSKATLIFDNPATVFFAAFMALWATFFLEFWKRQQNEIAFDWDLTGFEEEEERPRARFEAKIRRLRPNPVTGIEEPYQSEPNYYGKILSAMSVLAFFVILVLVVLVAIIIYRIVVADAFYKIQPSLAGIAATITASLIQVICIMVLSKVYEFLAVKLTNWELHRTQTEHEDSFTFKMFVFQFCNFYGSIFYIAFFKGNFAGYPPTYMKIGSYRLDECGAGGCLIELTIQLAIIMVGKQAINNFMEVVLPRIKAYLRDNTEVKLNRWEADYVLNPVPDHGLFREYLEMVLQYGFVTLFVTAFPLAPIFALLNNIIEIRLDANKLLTQTRRPFAARAEDIGIWYGILDTLSTFAVITNGLVISLTSGFIPRLVYQFTVENKQTIYGEYLGANKTTRGFALYEISVTSPAVFQQLNMTANNEKNAGIIKSYLEENPDLNATNLVCGYRGPKRLPNKADGTADLTTFYWHTVAGRLAFLVAFEHVVYFIKAIIAWLVPDIPKHIKQQQQREAFQSKTILRNHGMHCAVNEA